MDFKFMQAGAAISVHTEVGRGLARVHVDSSAPTRFAVIDRNTGGTVGTYGDRKRARTRANKLDLQYGAIRYLVREVPA